MAARRGRLVTRPRRARAYSAGARSESPAGPARAVLSSYAPHAFDRHSSALAARAGALHDRRLLQLLLAAPAAAGRQARPEPHPGGHAGRARLAVVVVRPAPVRADRRPPPPPLVHRLRPARGRVLHECDRHGGHLRHARGPADAGRDRRRRVPSPGGGARVRPLAASRLRDGGVRDRRHARLRLRAAGRGHHRRRVRARAHLDRRHPRPGDDRAAAVVVRAGDAPSPGGTQAARPRRAPGRAHTARGDLRGRR